jgi:NAD(P)H-hydrate repair Nnr-like enzyme with NAD(P)H-hydrate dehydratase domain
MQDYWQKQTKQKPLFEDLLWSRPEQAAHAGKLLIVGGNAHGFAAPAEAYGEADKAGIGVSRVLLPDSLQKTVGRILTNGEYAPSTPSGSFARSALASLLDMSNWADATLLAGDFGRNSETAILLEQFMSKYDGQVILTKDSADYFIPAPAALLNRPQTLLVVSFAQLQKMATSARFERAFTFDMDFLRLIDMLHDFSLRYKAALIVKHSDSILVAYEGQVSSTKLSNNVSVWRVKTAAYASVWQLQNPTKVFASLTTSILAVDQELT